MKRPVAEQRPHTHTEHGVERADPYHWLRKRDDPATIAYIEAENAYTKAHTDPLKAEAKALYDEMLGRIQETDTSAKINEKGFAYYHRTVEGLPYAIHCREPAAGGAEQVLLDENQVAEGHEYCKVAAATVSPDQRLLGYTVDTSGDEIFTLLVIELSTGDELDRVEGVSGGFCWGNDSRSLFWRELDAAQRPFRIHHRVLGAGAPADDPVIMEEPDERYRLGVMRTRFGRHLLMYAAHQESTEFWLIDGDAPLAPAHCVQPRAHGLVYEVEVDHEQLWILSTDGDDPNLKAPTYRLYTAPFAATSRDDWSVHLDARPDVALEDFAAFRTFCVRQERVNGVVRLIVIDRASGAEREVAMQEASYVAGRAWSPEYEEDGFHYHYSSMTTPPSTYRYDVGTSESQLLKQTPVPTYEPSAYRSTRIEVPAADGTPIPVSLVWKGTSATPPQGVPVLLYGYGSYGVTIDPAFSSTRVSLLDRGVVFAIAHIRGGGFLGRGWYESAKFLTKAHTFDDFISVARHLVASGITTREQLGIMGGSAGGMLMGGVMNRAPNLCKAVLAMVPFVDVVSTMLDASLPLTAGEWVEWGDPREREFFDAMLSYSPYDNVAAVDYPNVMITSGLNDPRVQYWEPTKWAAKLRATATGGQVLLKTHMGAGHQGRTGRYGYLEDLAEEYSWMIDQIT